MSTTETTKKPFIPLLADLAPTKITFSGEYDVQISNDKRTNKVWINAKELTPEKSQKLRNHSPGGFAWGYGGSGPAQLALSIMLEYYPRQAAISLYQHFKFNVIGRLPQEDIIEKEIILLPFNKEYYLPWVEKFKAEGEVVLYFPKKGFLGAHSKYYQCPFDGQPFFFDNFEGSPGVLADLEEVEAQIELCRQAEVPLVCPLDDDALLEKFYQMFDY